MAFAPIDENQYPTQLAEKQQQVSSLFSEFTTPPLEVFASAPLHFRMRAEFRIWHEGDECFYAMTPPGERKPQAITQFRIGSQPMVELMPRLLKAINQQPILRKRLFCCEFLTTLSNEILVTLIYHRRLDEQWQQEAQQLAKVLNIHLIGRSKKQKVILSQDYVTEELEVAGKSYRYQQVETGFTQPNAQVNEKMLTWAKQATTNSKGDLLELYCGNGNFTVVLSENFEKVMATELSKISVRSANVNLEANNVGNVTMVRMSSEEFSQALRRERPFRRLKDIDLDSYNFSTLFVDPPRSGLDEQTLALASGFEQILYISCNPQTLKNNLNSLYKTHTIENFALFDQFPYTPHIECGVLLKARENKLAHNMHE